MVSVTKIAQLPNPLQPLQLPIMITGLHAIIYSGDADKNRAFLRDMLGLKWVDAGHGWLIFAAPPAERAAHSMEADEEPHHELYLMCDNLQATMNDLAGKGVQ